MREKRWWNATVIGIGMASLFSDWSHEMATAILPTFLATLGGTAAALGLIEGVSDGISSFAKLGFGWYSDRLHRKKPLAVAGYFLTGAATAAFGFCTQIWQALAARALAWFGRGARTPIRKTLLAAATTPENYGKAFGLERAMDTCGAIIGPSCALWLLTHYHHQLRPIFLWSLVPGACAMAAIAFFVKESAQHVPSKYKFGESLRLLPSNFKRFLLAVGIFGLGDFSHTFLILFTAQQLASVYGAAKAAQMAMLLYVFHNVLYASSSYVAGHLADRFDKRALLSGGYFLAAATVILMIFAKNTLVSAALIVALAGIYVAVEEAVEDSFAAELLPQELRGTGFGALAFVNAIGDFASSIITGLLWAAFGLAAFLLPAVLFVTGASMVLVLVHKKQN